MGRNRLIYTLADHAIVVASDVEKGGTWAGATEALKAEWLPVFVLDHPICRRQPRPSKKGANSLPYPLPVKPAQLKTWLDEHILARKPQVTQPPAILAPGCNLQREVFIAQSNSSLQKAIRSTWLKRRVKKTPLYW